MAIPVDAPLSSYIQPPTRHFKKGFQGSKKNFNPNHKVQRHQAKVQVFKPAKTAIPNYVKPAVAQVWSKDRSANKGVASYKGRSVAPSSFKGRSTFKRDQYDKSHQNKQSGHRQQFKPNGSVKKDRKEEKSPKQAKMSFEELDAELEAYMKRD